MLAAHTVLMQAIANARDCNALPRAFKVSLFSLVFFGILQPAGPPRTACSRKRGAARRRMIRFRHPRKSRHPPQRTTTPRCHMSSPLQWPLPLLPRL